MIELYKITTWLQNQNDDDVPDDDDDDKKKPVDELAGDKLIKTGKPKASTATKSSAKPRKPTTKPRGGNNAKRNRIP
jgi:hypothetical protein